MSARIILFVAVLGFGELTGVRVAEACDCMSPRPVAGAFAEAKAVFEARVDAPVERRTVHLTVTRAWKGVQVGTELSIPLDRCDYNFVAAGTYLVYASAGDPGSDFSVSVCSRTAPIAAAAADVAELGRIAPRAADPGPITTDPPAAAASPVAPTPVAPTQEAPKVSPGLQDRSNATQCSAAGYSAADLWWAVALLPGMRRRRRTQI